jgi:hypothetical protein
MTLRGKRLSRVAEALGIGFLADRLLIELSKANGSYLSPEDMKVLKGRLEDLGKRTLVVADMELHEVGY